MLLLLALAYRIALLFAIPRAIDSADAVYYLNIARDFPGSFAEALRLSIPPLYPALSALAQFAIPDIEWASRIVSLVGSVALTGVVYAFARRMHGRGAGFVSGIVIAIWPWLADYGCRVGTEGIAAPLWFFAIYAFARGICGKGPWLVWSVIAFMGLHLARPEGTFLMLAAIPAAAILCSGQGPGYCKRLVPFILAVVVFLAAWGAVAHVFTGTAAINQRMRGGFSFLGFLGKNLEPFAKTGLETWGFVLPVMVGPYLLLFAGLGLFGRSHRRRDIRLEVLLGFFCVFQWLMAVLSASPAPRYMMPVVIALGIWASRGLVMATDQLSGLPRGRWLRILPLAGMGAVTLVSLGVMLAPYFLSGLPPIPYEYKVAGRWMRENLPEGPIFTRKPQIAFYADMPSIGPAGDETVETVGARALGSGARYVVVDERYTPQIVPGLAPLLDPGVAPPGLRLIRDDLSPYPEGRVAIYEVLPAGDESP